MVSVGPSDKRGCDLCSAVHRPFVCPECVNKVVLAEGKTDLLALIRKRDAVLAQLKEKIEEQMVVQQQQAKRQIAAVELRRVSGRAARAQQRLKEVKHAIASLRKSCSTRQTQVEEASAQLLDKRKEKLYRYLPVRSRVTDLTYNCLHSSLQEEWSTKIRQLLEVLPFSINGQTPQHNTPVQVAVLNLLLPNGPLSALYLRQKPEASDAALGYVLLFLNLVSLYTGAPVIHHSYFKCSSSSVWEPQSYWERQPASAADMLPLYAPRPLQTQLATSGWPSTSGDQSFCHQQHQTEDAIRLLRRSIGVFVAHQLGPLGGQLPRRWSSFLSLAWICSQVARDCLQWALQQLKPASVQENGIATSSSFITDDEDDQEEDADGWCCIRGSFLPPPPSKPDDVEHWTQAMLTDKKSQWQGRRLNLLRAWPVLSLNAS